MLSRWVNMLCDLWLTIHANHQQTEHQLTLLRVWAGKQFPWVVLHPMPHCFATRDTQKSKIVLLEFVRMDKRKEKSKAKKQKKKRGTSADHQNQNKNILLTSVMNVRCCWVDECRTNGTFLNGRVGLLSKYFRRAWNLLGFISVNPIEKWNPAWCIFNWVCKEMQRTNFVQRNHG